MVPTLPADPVLPGATWRPLTLADATALETAVEAARVVDGGQEVRTRDDLARELADPRAPAATNTLGLALQDGSLATWAIVHERFHARLARRAVLEGDTHPAVRGRAIGTQLLRWAIARGEETLAAQPADLPRLEPVQPDDWDRDVVGDPHFRVDLSFVALAGDEVAGHSANYCSEADWVASEVRDAWIGQLGVRRAWRGRGLATALVVRSMSSFRAVGMDAASLGVDAETRPAPWASTNGSASSSTGVSCASAAPSRTEAG